MLPCHAGSPPRNECCLYCYAAHCTAAVPFRDKSLALLCCAYVPLALCNKYLDS